MKTTIWVDKNIFYLSPDGRKVMDTVQSLKEKDFSLAERVLNGEKVEIPLIHYSVTHEGELIGEKDVFLIVYKTKAKDEFERSKDYASLKRKEKVSPTLIDIEKKEIFVFRVVTRGNDRRKYVFGLGIDFYQSSSDGIGVIWEREWSRKVLLPLPKEGVATKGEFFKIGKTDYAPKWPYLIPIYFPEKFSPIPGLAYPAPYLDTTNKSIYGQYFQIVNDETVSYLKHNIKAFAILATYASSALSIPLFRFYFAVNESSLSPKETMKSATVESELVSAGYSYSFIAVKRNEEELLSESYKNISEFDNSVEIEERELVLDMDFYKSYKDEENLFIPTLMKKSRFRDKVILRKTESSIDGWFFYDYRNMGLKKEDWLNPMEITGDPLSALFQFFFNPYRYEKWMKDLMWRLRFSSIYGSPFLLKALEKDFPFILKTKDIILFPVVTSLFSPKKNAPSKEGFALMVLFPLSVNEFFWDVVVTEPVHYGRGWQKLNASPKFGEKSKNFELWFYWEAVREKKAFSKRAVIVTSHSPNSYIYYYAYNREQEGGMQGEIKYSPKNLEIMKNTLNSFLNYK